MTPAQPMTVRTLAFGDLETGLWGVAGSSTGGAVASFADTFELDPGAPGQESLVAAAGLELRFSPVSAPAPFLPSAAGIGGILELCEVRGAVHADGAEREVACFGARAELTLPIGDVSSARLATGWFGEALGFTVVSLRPSRARGHEHDLVACAFVDDGDPLEIDDPRLSTTYTESGLPLRAGLELWPVENEPEEQTPTEAAAGDTTQDGNPDRGDDPDGGDEDDRPAPYYPRRVGGDSARDASVLALPTVAVRAELFRWRTRGREGAGVYALAPAP
jgi:hypothetical protein